MTNPPQSITQRYVNRLLVAGGNEHFSLLRLEQTGSFVDGISVGTYYNALIGLIGDLEKREAAGATPRQAVERALQKFGVTFR